MAIACIQADAGSSHKILILNESDFTRPFLVAHALAIREALTHAPIVDAQIDVEMLDLDRHPDEEYRAWLTRLITEKNRQQPPDVIVTLGAQALTFAVGLRATFNRQIPLVYTAIDDAQRETLVMPPMTTGINLHHRITDEVRFIRNAFPDITRIAILGNTTLPGTHPLSVRTELPEISKLIDIIDLTGLSLDELVHRVDRLPEHTVIFYYGINADRSGRVFIPEEGLVVLSQIANRPIFVPTYNLMGYGPTGGLMIKPKDGAAEVANLARRILSGVKADELQPINVEARKGVFDYRQLVKWGIDKNKLPADSELMFYEPSLWEKYAREIVIVVVILALQSATIIMLVVEHRRRRRAELEFRRSMTDLAQLNRATALGELSASIAHELNQPLAAMQSNAEAAEEMLESDPPAVVEAKGILSDIQHETQRAAGIIRSMRSLFRKTEFTPAPVRLNEVVREMLRFVAWEARSHGVQLVTSIDSEVGSVMGDRIQLDQVVLNLLTNAIESAQTGDDPHSVTIGTRRTGNGEIELFVEDTGPGIPEADLLHIFEPYYTTKAQGMGMGLSISRNIVEAHGGRLNAESLPGSGARFCFALKEI